MARPSTGCDSELRRRVRNEVQRAVHIALAQHEHERRFLVPFDDLLESVERHLRRSGLCADAARRARPDGRAREILTCKRETLATDLWTQALLLQYDPTARDVRETVARIVRDAEPKTMRELVARFAATYPSAAQPTCPHGTLTFAVPVAVASPKPTAPPRRSWADVARSTPAAQPVHRGCIARYCFPSQATWAAFRLHAFEWYRPLVDAEDVDANGNRVALVERTRWGDLDENPTHALRIQNHVATSLSVPLVRYAPPSPGSDSDADGSMTASCDLEDLRGGLPPLWAMTPSPTTTPTPSPAPPDASPTRTSPMSSPPVARSWADMCD